MSLSRNDWDKDWSDDFVVYVPENCDPFRVVLRETTSPVAAEMRSALAAAKTGDGQAMENIRDWLWRATSGGMSRSGCLATRRRQPIQSWSRG